MIPERRTIPGWEGIYEVDTEGNVYSLPRLVWRCNGRRHPVKGRKLRTGAQSEYGHLMVVLCRDTQRHTASVHRLVALAFLGPPPPGHEVCHIDGNASNNRLDNLRYGTKLSNAADMLVHGTRLLGERHRDAKVAERDVVCIRARHKAGESFASLARTYGLDPSTVWRICSGELWKHVPFEAAA